jgi:hypothetical protein
MMADGDRVDFDPVYHPDAVGSTMNGRHVEPWAVYSEDGEVDTVFPPTNKTFAMTQSHWFRSTTAGSSSTRRTATTSEWAKQLGWIPPTPSYLFKMALAKRRARHA